jgi:hypothetical protein
MRKAAGILVVVLASTLGGCDSSSAKLPTVPSVAVPPTTTPPLPSVPPELWSVTVTYAGHTGPAACLPPFDGNVVQTPITGVIGMFRSGTSLTVVTEHDQYKGAVVADGYSATDSDGGTWQCGAARLTFRSEGFVSGRFSTDGRSLTGEEGVVFRLESGETITRRWDWKGTRKE